MYFFYFHISYEICIALKSSGTIYLSQAIHRHVKKLIKEEKLKYSRLSLALHPELSVVLYFFSLVSITAKGQSVSFNKQVLLFVC